MSTSSPFSFVPRWTSQELVDAVPLRLFELLAFDAGADGSNLARSANHAPRPRAWRHGYWPQPTLPELVRIR